MTPNLASYLLTMKLPSLKSGEHRSDWRLTGFLMGKLANEKQLEIAFITIFSVLVLLIFYTVVSMNGVVLGNDPAVHLVKAQIFLNTGKIPLENLGWTPPLYELLACHAYFFHWCIRHWTDDFPSESSRSGG